MPNFSTKLNLTGLKHQVTKMKGKDGMIDVVVLPIAANNLFKGDKGVYLDLSHIELDNPKYDDTHLVKQSLPKEVYEKLTEDQKRAIPIIGNSKVWGSSEQIGEEIEGEVVLDGHLPF